MLYLGVKCGMIGRQTFEAQCMKWQKDQTLKTSSGKLTLTCVRMHTPCKLSGFTSSITMKFWWEQD